MKKGVKGICIVLWYMHVSLLLIMGLKVRLSRYENDGYFTINYLSIDVSTWNKRLATFVRCRYLIMLKKLICLGENIEKKSKIYSFEF